MTIRPAVVLALSVALAATMAAGCTRRTATLAGAPQTGSIEQTSGIEGSGTGDPGIASQPGATSGGKVDVGSIDDQLKAMQKELDGMKMPSDADFNGAAGSVY